MVQTPTKRHASRSPDGARPSKRAATSSPEEGELDDASPLLAPQSLPAKPSTQSKAKVPFPFKKKAEPTRNGVTTGVTKIPEPKEKVLPVVYERSEEDERKIREADLKRKNARPMKATTADHWEPSYGRAERPVNASARHYVPRDHDRRSDWDYPSVPSRGERDHHRDRARSSPSSHSPTHSRSPSSPLPSNHREKHRLPAPRSPEPSFSPPRRDYGVDRIRDRERERGGTWDRERDRERRYRDDDDGDHSYDSRYYSREWAHESHADSGDRHWRPANSHHDHRQGGAEIRDWTRRDDSYDRRSRLDDREHYDRNYDHVRRPDSYRPSSSGPSSRPPATPPPPPGLSSPPPGSQSPGELRTPPPPAISPPPPPPPDMRMSKDQTLPTNHAAVSISIPMKRPGAPREVHSPPSMVLPLAREVSGEDKERRAQEPLREKVVLSQSRRREPVRRSRKDEEKAYGRAFAGCSDQADYQVTTKLGEGTFGEVHKAIHKATGNAVALKRILMHNEKEGMPVTALREIKILKALKHPCIVEILDMFVVRSSAKDPLSVYMVFPYMDHDLAGLLENERVKLQPSHIKLYMKQLLEGTEYMHRNHILHRDMKAANLLISNSGSLRIADFGLARAFDANVSRGADHRGKERKYTNCVVTRWYRPPELLLGARQYGGEVDIWGIGCVLGEMFSRRPILPGTSDLDQLEKIWQLCGTPNQHNWPNHDALPGCEGVKRFNPTYSRKIKQAYESVEPDTCDLLDKLLTCNPSKRITASQALDHDYFWTDPLPADPKTLPSYEASHEFDKRGHRNHHPPVGPQILPQGDGQPRHLPPPTQPPLHFGRNQPPPRDMHTGPPAPPFLPPGQGLPPPHPYPPHLNPNQHPHPHPPPFPPGRPGPFPPHGMPRGGRGHGPGPPHPSYRPGHPPGRPRHDQWEPQKPRPSHLPPRPSAPLGRGGGPGPESGRGGHLRGGYGTGRGGLNGNINGSVGGGGGELNYG